MINYNQIVVYCLDFIFFNYKTYLFNHSNLLNIKGHKVNIYECRFI